MSEPDPPGLNDTPAAFDADYDERSAAADADVAAGRVVPHEEVVKWLKTWGTADEMPPPFSWRRQPQTGGLHD